MTDQLLVRTSNATAPLLQALAQALRAQGGPALDLAVSSSSVAPGEIEAGARADIAVLQQGSIAALAEKGIFRAGDIFPFARSCIGLAVKQGAPKPVIDSVEHFKHAVLAARSIARTEGGPSGRYFPILMQRLGIAEAVLPKCVTRPGGYIGQLVADGEAEIAFHQIGELMAVPGIDILGPIPEPLQQPVVSKAAIFADSQNRKSAKYAIAFFLRPENAALFVAAGLKQGDERTEKST
ncbi:MAG: substrate-binding domain-containing protein [Beijerinckiaceae bacterium]